MLETKIKKKIFKKLEAMDESLGYDIDALIELKTNVQTIYFFFLC